MPVVLHKNSGGSVTVDGSEVIPDGEFSAYVGDRETDHPRWVWDDTNRWYPRLLTAGVRVKHCLDLRLSHNILRRSPLVDQTTFASDEAQQWDHFAPDAAAPEAALFTVASASQSLDALGEYKRQVDALTTCPEAKRLQLLLNAESSGALIAAEMAFVGLPWNADIHNALLTELLGPRPAANARPVKLEALARVIRTALDAPDLNPDSPAEVLRVLRLAGLDVKDTRSSTLERLAHPAIGPLLEYKKLRRLDTASGWRWLDTWVRDGRYKTTFVPGGVVTGRWAASGGGALSLPVQLRPAVVADDGWVFVVADVAQLEPRTLAGMSGDQAMANAAQGADLYQGLVDAGVVPTRDDAKLAMLGAMYGATRGDSAKMVARLAERYPKAFGLLEDAARKGERGEVVRTFLGRGSPVPDAGWVAELGDQSESNTNANDRRSWGRFTRNFVVQGTGAEWAISWMATLRNLLSSIESSAPLAAQPHLVFFLHDEIVVHTPAHHADSVEAAVREAARRAGVLVFGSFPVDFPLDVSQVKTYADAK